MSARYHPIVDTLWNDDALEGMPFEGKAFFAYLCSNHRQRPSGIYRATDEQLAMDSGLPIRRVRAYLLDLGERGRVVRDGAWIFVRGYFGRQPKHDNLLAGVRLDLKDCSSDTVRASFFLRYSHYSQWSGDRRATVGRPMNEIRPTEQSSTEQSSTEHVCTEPPRPLVPAHANGTASQAMLEILTVLARCPAFGTSAQLRDEAFWLHEIRANPDVDVLAQTTKAQAWLTAHPRQRKRDVRKFLHNWFANPLARE